MALTAIERTILEKARERIKSQKDSFVCYAIDAARVPGYDAKQRNAAKTRLRDYVSRKIAHSGTLGYWLAKKHNNRFMSQELQREARIAWITWMLGEPVEVDAQTLRGFASYLNPWPNAHPQENHPLA